MAAAAHACRKHRIHQLFARPEAERIDLAIRTAVHPVMSETTLLLKHRLYEETVRLGPAGRNMAPLVLEEEDVERAISAVIGKVQVRTTRGADASQADAGMQQRLQAANAWVDSYDRMLCSPSVVVTQDAEGEARDRLPLEGRLDGLSVRRILSLAVRQYVATLLTNVREHYPDYVRRTAGLELRHRAAVAEGVVRFDDLSKSQKRAWGSRIRVAYDDLLNFREGGIMRSVQPLRDVVNRLRAFLVPDRPFGASPSITVDDDLCNAGRCYVYLGYMVRMTRILQAAGQKSLPTPVPLKTSFIPAHYSIDTGSLCHLLFDGKRKTLPKFAKFFEHSVRGGFALPRLSDKADVCRGLAHLCGPERLVTKEDDQRFMDALWMYLGRFNVRKTKLLMPTFRVTRLRRYRVGEEGKMFLFDHSISSDGYSVSLVVSSEATRGRKAFKPVVKNRAPKKKTRRGAGPDVDEDGVPVDTTGLPLLTSQTAEYWVGRLAGPDLCHARRVGCDPGKGVLAQLVGTVDGARKKLSYTAAQRRFEAGGRRATKALRHARAKTLHNSSERLKFAGVSSKASIEAIEKEVLRTCSPRAATLPAFREYVRKRDAVRSTLEQLYSSLTFRWRRFLVWRARDSSVMRFAKKIVETFGSGGHPVVLFYGDWGRHPNLKNQAPTPGIGLRRLLHAFPGILTVTVREWYTSSYCPCCQTSVEEARGKHALLRCCTAEGGCGMYWSRDVLGASNILSKAEYLLANPGTAHPLFLE